MSIPCEGRSRKSGPLALPYGLFQTLGRGGILAMLAILLLGPSVKPISAEEAPPLVCQEGKVCREPKTQLPARVLTRPFSLIYKDKSAAPESVLSNNVAPFSPLYIFAREDLDLSDPNHVKGWYRVAVDANGAPLGWMSAEDVVEWRQALVLAFAHPGVGSEARQRVVLFDNREALDRLTELDDAARRAEVEALNAGIDKAVKAGSEAPAGVVSIEGPFIDIKDQFYMLPILQFEDLGSRFVDESRIVQIVAVSETRAASDENSLQAQKQPAAVDDDKGKAGQQIGLRDVTGSVPEAAATAPPGGRLSDLPSSTSTSPQQGLSDLPAASVAQLKSRGFDIVFVMDMTGSMAPFVQNATKAIREVARSITEDPDIAEGIRFGFVGYRDDVAKLPNVEFTSKNFTPHGTLAVDAFLKMMDTPTQEVGDFAAGQVGSGDYQEEVFAGVQEALSTKWNEPSLRFVILVGDASSHEVGHEQNTTGLDAVTLRQQLNTQTVNVFSIHLKEDRAASDHALAEEQFSALATNEGVDKPYYYPLAATDSASYSQTVKDIAAGLAEVIRKFRKGDVKGLAASAEATSDNAEGGTTQVRSDVAKLGFAAVLPYLNKAQGAKPPRDFLAWAFDRDLIDPSKSALQVRVLLTREQVNDLVFTAEKVSQAIKAAQLTQLQFFEALQSVTLVGVKGQEIDYNKAEALRGSGLASAWLESLPYKSAVLNLNNDMYAAMSPDDRAQIESSLAAKLELYRDLLANADIWTRPRDDSPDEDRFYPLELSSLP